MNKKDITSAFNDIDTLSDIDFIIQFLDTANQKTAVKDCKRHHMEEQMQIRPGIIYWTSGVVQVMMSGDWQNSQAVTERLAVLILVKN